MSTWLIPLLTALAGALAAYIPSMRRLSGRVTSTEAGTLWEEARLLRQEYRDRIATLVETIDRLRAELEACQRARVELEARLARTRISEPPLA